MLGVLVPLQVPCFLSFVFARWLALEVTTLTMCHLLTNISFYPDVVIPALVLFRRIIHMFAGVDRLKCMQG